MSPEGHAGNAFSQYWKRGAHSKDATRLGLAGFRFGGRTARLCGGCFVPFEEALGEAEPARERNNDEDAGLLEEGKG